MSYPSVKRQLQYKKVNSKGCYSSVQAHRLVKQGTIFFLFTPQVAPVWLNFILVHTYTTFPSIRPSLQPFGLPTSLQVVLLSCPLLVPSPPNQSVQSSNKALVGGRTVLILSLDFFLSFFLSFFLCLFYPFFILILFLILFLIFFTALRSPYVLSCLLSLPIQLFLLRLLVLCLTLPAPVQTRCCRPTLPTDLSFCLTFCLCKRQVVSQKVSVSSHLLVLCYLPLPTEQYLASQSSCQPTDPFSLSAPCLSAYLACLRKEEGKRDRIHEGQEKEKEGWMDRLVL